MNKRKLKNLIKIIKNNGKCSGVCQCNNCLLWVKIKSDDKNYIYYRDVMMCKAKYDRNNILIFCKSILSNYKLKLIRRKKNH
jgi:exosome complex RNA-binding protein Rrp4